MALSQFDNEFNPQSSGRPDGLDTLPDGDYTLTITRCELDEVQVRGGDVVDVVRWTYRTQTGQMVENTTWLRDSRACSMLGADLALLGFPTQTWTAAHGKPFSVALPEATHQMPGIAFLATKSSYEKNGRVYHNLRIKGRAGAAPMPAPAKLPGGPVQQHMALPHEQLPF